MYRVFIIIKYKYNTTKYRMYRKFTLEYNITILFIRFKENFSLVNNWLQFSSLEEKRRGNERKKTDRKKVKKRRRERERQREIMRLLLYTKCPIIFMLYGATQLRWPGSHKLANSWLRLWPVVNWLFRYTRWEAMQDSRSAVKRAMCRLCLTANATDATPAAAANVWNARFLSARSHFPPTMDVLVWDYYFYNLRTSV